MKERNLDYEKKFRAYLFKGCSDRHKEICKEINVKPNLTKWEFKQGGECRICHRVEVTELNYSGVCEECYNG